RFCHPRHVPEPSDLERRATELLQRLIRIDTVNPPGNERPAQELLKGLLEAAGFECELLEAVEGRPNLVARLESGSDGPRLLYLGHVDTVLARPEEWSVDPWSGELRAGGCTRSASPRRACFASRSQRRAAPATPRSRASATTRSRRWRRSSRRSAPAWARSS